MSTFHQFQSDYFIFYKIDREVKKKLFFAQFLLIFNNIEDPNILHYFKFANIFNPLPSIAIF